ncbi:hypothetical protein MIMGU_mgv11b020841mg [Erythranthe guttata]|uniref:Glucose-6-phosphate 1-epimerase n=1 Tax=Erythranthe guttata TaxID=4155 RepID=A0A022PYK6_ERYGU|nr:hypothetical protein MIMGU_mgv11b020841mg [Erythranthe guttata]
MSMSWRHVWIGLRGYLFTYTESCVRSFSVNLVATPPRYVLLYGGQVVSWVNERGDQLLFLSEKEFEANKPICGGIPICFPKVSDVRIEGLEVLDYVDYMKNNERFNQGSDVVTFESQVNRAYFNTIGMIAVMDHLALRTYTIRKSRGLPDIVVWNPWEKELSQWDWKMEDLAKGNYRKFVCVEAANVENEITLKPFEEWIGIQHLSAHPGSYDDHLPNPGSIL